MPQKCARLAPTGLLDDLCALRGRRLNKRRCNLAKKGSKSSPSVKSQQERVPWASKLPKDCPKELARDVRIICQEFPNNFLGVAKEFKISFLGTIKYEHRASSCQGEPESGQVDVHKEALRKLLRDLFKEIPWQLLRNY